MIQIRPDTVPDQQHWNIAKGSVADSDPYPSFHFDVDPDGADPDPTFDFDEIRIQFLPRHSDANYNPE
jgi:hypothetical protein